MTCSEQSQRVSAELTLRKSGRAEISIFGNEPATPKQVAVSVMKLSKAFPQMSIDFFNLLSERIAAKKISADRLDYAVNHIIDNYTYQKLTIADIMSIDSRVEVMSYAEMTAECKKRGCSTDDYAPLFMGENKKPFWIHQADKVKYNIPDRL